jgi:hypothetical protein
MSDDDEAEKQRFARLIGEAQEHAHGWHETCLQTWLGVSDVPRERARRQFHAAVMSYWGLLQRYRDESQLRTEWRADFGDDEDAAEQRDEWTVEIDGEPTTLAELGEWRRRTRERTTVSGGPTTGTHETTHVEPAVLSVDASIAVLDLLDRVSHLLGFTAEARDVTPHTEPDHEDLRGLVELRGQEDVVENLPGGDS